jgi:hypothetical protein
MDDRPVSVKQPQQAQEPDEHDLAHNRVTVYEKGDCAANHGGFNQIKNRHNTVFGFGRGPQRLASCAKPPPLA